MQHTSGNLTPVKSVCNRTGSLNEYLSVIGFINRSFIQKEQLHVVYVHNGKTVATSSNLKHAHTRHC